MLRNFEGQTPEIEYPAEWTFKVVGRSVEILEIAVSTHVAREYELRASKTSRTGKYVSLELILTVTSDEDRRTLGQLLHDDERVLFVF